jgi:alkylhydroperoxidase family enzyme
VGATPEDTRIPSIPVREWPSEMRQALAALYPSDAERPTLRSEGRPKALNALGTFAWHPTLTQAFNTFNGHLLYTSTLSDRHRELLVLRVAIVRDAEYERRQHVVLAADVGISPEEIDWITEGPDAGAWTPLERAMLRAVDELVSDARISDATWGELASGLRTEQLMDLVFTVGAYDLLAMAFRSFGVVPDDDLPA